MAKLSPAKRGMIWTAIVAFAAFMLLINTNSAHADANNLNTAYLVVGIILAVVAILLFYFKVVKNSNSETGYSDRE